MVDGASPLTVTLWDVTIDAFGVVLDPYAVVVPYSTWLSAPSLLVHVTVAPLTDTPDAVTADSVGGVTSGAVVVNVKSADTVRFPAASLLLTR